MAIDKVNGIPQYKPIPSNKEGVKKYQQGDLILEVDDKKKTWIHRVTGKVIAKGPLTQDTFQKEQPVDLKGEVVNKNGIINN